MTASKRTSESGNLLIELALTLPIFALIGLCGLEFANAMRDKQMAQVLSRAAARSALHCTAFALHRQPKPTEHDGQACLQSALGSVQAEVSAVAPGSQISIALLSRDLSAGPGSTIYEEALAGGGERKLAPVDPGLLTSGNLSNEMLNKQGVIIVAEVNLARQNFFNYIQISTLYDATIM